MADERIQRLKQAILDFDEEQAVNARVDHAVDGALERLEVELALLGQRNDDGGNDAAKR